MHHCLSLPTVSSVVSYPPKSNNASGTLLCINIYVVFDFVNLTYSGLRNSFFSAKAHVECLQGCADVSCGA